MAFLIDPIAPEDFRPYAAVEETVLPHDPFEARYAFVVGEDVLTSTVDADLAVVDAPEEGRDAH